MNSIRVQTVLMSADALGGVWTYCLELVKALKPAGVNVVVANMGGSPCADQVKQAAGLSNLELLDGPYKLEWMDEPWGDVDEAGKWLLEIRDRFRPDVIHLNGYAHAALPWRTPVLTVAHSCVASWWRAVKGGSAPPEWDVYRERVRAGLIASDLVVAPTRTMINEIQIDYGALNHAVVIPNARELDLDRIVKEPFVFAAGRIWDEAKNISTLDKISASIRWPTFLAGDSGENTRNEGARRLGRLNPLQMASWLSRASIYALPARYEPFGLSVLEAALAGCALVLGDIGSLRENWNGCAEFVDPDDAEQLLRSLRSLISDEDKRNQLGHLARMRADRFNLRSQAEEYMAAYRSICTSAPLYGAGGKALVI